MGTFTVGTTERVLKGTSAFKVELFSPCGSDVEAFESWYKQGLVTKKSKNIPEQEALKPLVVKMVPKLPQQKNNGDCGIYVIKYDEYFINEMLKEMPKIFNIAQVRKHLVTQLYVYAKKKQVENYDTDNDWVPKDV
ncbi:Ulp1 protease family [Abeliophyllum distichum]|uniref:Ulp1 protease family n=1 Tax=Abeliophyllum distichum TaxID=126358 RepID=A0ABD1TJQ8_9LAMI